MTAMFFLLLSAPFQPVVHAGNPVLEVVASVPGEQVASAWFEIDQVVLEGCDASVTTIAVDDTIDLSTAWSLAIPAGDWCGVSLTTESAEVSGHNQGGPWAFSSDAPTVSWDPAASGTGLALPGASLTEGVVHAGNPVLDLMIY